MKKAIYLLLVILLIPMMIVGCYSKMDYQDEAMDSVTGYLGVDESALTMSTKSVSQTDMSDSHSIMAAMILKNAGQDSDLESYEKVYLTDVTLNSTGKSAKVVIIVKDGVTSTVIPANLEEQLGQQ